jgi:2-polyprenyl-3-methyl-5-hydroxy-6-metoxy-1,4-benzoquinol methylase
MQTQDDQSVANPYREAFYSRQAEWHGYQSVESVKSKHENRRKYYKWCTKNWIPESRTTPALDIGCGSGQFLYFLREEGYQDVTGIDVDRDQVEIGRALGLDTRLADAGEFLAASDQSYGLISMLDILEHFRRDELFPLLEAVSAHLAPGGRIIASVPNGESPEAARAIYADITHEIAFTPTSLGELFFCHGLRVKDLRDPWPAPVSPLRRVYRGLTMLTRSVEALRLRSLGLSVPAYWSSVVWVVAEKPA